MSVNQQSNPSQGEASDYSAAQLSSELAIADSSTAAYTVYPPRTMNQLYSEVRNEDETTRVMDIMAFHYIDIYENSQYEEVHRANPQGNPEDELENEPCFDVGDIVRLRRRGSADDDDEDDESIWDDLSKVSGVCFKVIDTSYEEDNSDDDSEGSPATPLASSPTPTPTLTFSVPDADSSYDGDDEGDVKKEDVEEGQEDVKEDAMDIDSDLDETMNGDDESDGDSTDEKEKGPKVFFYRLKTVEPHPEFLTFDHFWVREDRLVQDAEAMDICTDDNEVEENNGDPMEGVAVAENKTRQPWFGLWK